MPFVHLCAGRRFIQSHYFISFLFFVFSNALNRKVVSCCSFYEREVNIQAFRHIRCSSTSVCDIAVTRHFQTARLLRVLWRFMFLNSAELCLSVFKPCSCADVLVCTVGASTCATVCICQPESVRACKSSRALGRLIYQNKCLWLPVDGWPLGPLWSPLSHHVVEIEDRRGKSWQRKQGRHLLCE